MWLSRISAKSVCYQLNFSRNFGSRVNSANPDISRNFCLAIWIFFRFQIVGLLPLSPPLPLHTVLRLSGRYLTWCFICCTTFSLSDSPSDVHVALASSCCRLSVLRDVTRGRDDVTVVVRMLSSSQSDVLVPVDSRLSIAHTPVKPRITV